VRGYRLTGRGCQLEANRRDEEVVLYHASVLERDSYLLPDWHGKCRGDKLEFARRNLHRKRRVRRCLNLDGGRSTPCLNRDRHTCRDDGNDADARKPQMLSVAHAMTSRHPANKISSAAAPGATPLCARGQVTLRCQ